MTTPNNHALVTALDAAVPLRIWEYQARGGPTSEDLRRVVSLSQTLSERGDRLLYKSEKPGETAELFNKFADVLAVLSFNPGGVRFAGRHWETKRGDDKPQDPNPPIPPARPEQKGVSGGRNPRRRR